MSDTQFRNLTTEELFPQAFQQDLIKKQSEYFVSNALAQGSVESGYNNMPSGFPSAPSNSPLIVNSKPPQKYIGNYLKNNWRPLLVVLMLGSVATYVYLKSKEEKGKKTRFQSKFKNIS
jgi:hypothetical protein